MTTKMLCSTYLVGPEKSALGICGCPQSPNSARLLLYFNPSRGEFKVCHIDKWKRVTLIFNWMFKFLSQAAVTSTSPWCECRHLWVNNLNTAQHSTAGLTGSSLICQCSLSCQGICVGGEQGARGHPRPSVDSIVSYSHPSVMIILPILHLLTVGSTPV